MAAIANLLRLPGLWNRHLPASLFLSAFAASTGFAGELTFTTEDNPPYNYSLDGGTTVTGGATDILHEMLRRTGIKASVTLYPWARAYKLGLEQADTCVYSAPRIEQREKLFKWVGPLSDDDWMLFAKASSKITLNALEDAKTFSIATYHGSAVSTYLMDLGYKVYEANSDENDVKMLNMDRVDLWASGSRTGPFVAAKHKVEVKSLLTFKKTKLFLACNVSVDDALIDKMNKAIHDMETDGTKARLFKKYQ